MKFLMVLSLLTLSTAAFALSLNTNEAYLQEIHDGGASERTVSLTHFDVVSKIDNNYVLQGTSGTEWQNGAQLINVTALTMVATGTSGAVTIYEVDGNYMGSIETKINMSCDKQPHVILCQAVLSNKNKLVLGIGL